MNRVIACCALLGFFVFACSSESPTGSGSVQGTPGSVGYQSTAVGLVGGVPADYVATPAGYFHKSCVHLVPNGATGDDNDNVTMNGVVSHYAPCAYPVIWSLGGQGGRGEGGDAAVPTIGHTWVESNEQDTGGVGFNYLYADFYVPSNPSTNENQIIYLFPALQNNGQSSYPLIQPVLGWNSQGCANGTWCMASWWLTSGTNYYQSQPYQVYQGDELAGTMWVSGVWFNKLRQGPFPTWTIKTQDLALGESTTVTFNTLYDMLTSSPGVLEVYSINQCSDYPNATGTTFFNINLGVPTSSWLNWSYVNYCPSDHNAQSGLTPWCNYQVYDTCPGATTGWVTLDY